MIGTLVFTIAGLVLIIVHASGKWLTSTVSELSLSLLEFFSTLLDFSQPINWPHQMFGIVAALAVGINVRFIRYRI